MATLSLFAEQFTDGTNGLADIGVRENLPVRAALSHELMLARAGFFFYSRVSSPQIDRSDL
jgi:hypothetical protein